MNYRAELTKSSNVITQSHTIPFQVIRMTIEEAMEYKFSLLNLLTDWITSYFKTDTHKPKKYRDSSITEDWRSIAFDVRSYFELKWSKDFKSDIYLLITDKIQGIAICSFIEKKGKSYYKLNQLITSEENLLENGMTGVGTALLSSIVNHMKGDKILEPLQLRVVAGYIRSDVWKFYKKRMFIGRGLGRYYLSPDKFEVFLQNYAPPEWSTLVPLMNNTEYAKSANTFNALSCIYESKIEMENNELIIRFFSFFLKPETFPENYYLSTLLIKELLEHIMNSQTKEKWATLTLSILTKGKHDKYIIKDFLKKNGFVLVPILDSCELISAQLISSAIGFSEIDFFQKVYGTCCSNDTISITQCSQLFFTPEATSKSIVRLYYSILIAIDNYLTEERTKKDDLFFSAYGMNAAESMLKLFKNKNLSENFKMLVFNVLMTDVPKLKNHVKKFITMEDTLHIENKANQYNTNNETLSSLKQYLPEIMHEKIDSINFEEITENELIDIAKVKAEKICIIQ